MRYLERIASLEIRIMELEAELETQFTPSSAGALERHTQAAVAEAHRADAAIIDKEAADRQGTMLPGLIRVLTGAAERIRAQITGAQGSSFATGQGTVTPPAKGAGIGSTEPAPPDQRDETIARLRNALRKLRSYNEDIAAGRINYRSEDHITVANRALLESEGK
jgi:hypothetical protein